MILVLSPAKSLDFETPPAVSAFSQPDFLDRSAVLMEILRPLAPFELASLMSISDKLAVLNAGRNGEWAPPFTPDNAKQAALAFDGDVYDGLAAPAMTPEDLDFAQEHLRILSGLYGLLRPLDLIQPYRLEMGTRLANPGGKDLYAFWGDRLAQALNALLERDAEPVLVNLASEEYFKAVMARRLRFPVIQPVFEDWKNGRYKIISFYAKRARGLMARYAITNRLTEPEALKGFDLDGYAFAPQPSDESTWVFRRRQA
ncbi:MAG: peroxide stress protein YaaA [Rhodocyclaceae bacterium]|nr:peroxide stress protein YaaA [Rhodocyclaceae bacterium]